jgi:hypothetical protein
MSVIEFTANHEDLSTDRGYQFKFYCDRCGNGYMSRFQPSGSRTTGGLFRVAGGIFGGILASAGTNGNQVQRSGTVRAHESASDRAVSEAKGYFKKCNGCSKWVCPDGCWNAKAAQCEECCPRSVDG